MRKLVAKYQVKVPSILMEGEEVLELEPIRVVTHIGEVVIYPPGLQDRKPKGYTEPKQSTIVTAESKGSQLWEADTLRVDIETDRTPASSDEEMRTKLGREMHGLTFRFLRLLRRKLPEAAMYLPASLRPSVNFEWYERPSDPHLVTKMVAWCPFEFKVVSRGAGLTKEKWIELQREMSSEVEIGLYEDFIVDARAALEEGDLSRAALCVAVACEIFIKEYTEKAAKEGGISQEFWKYVKSRRPRVVDYYDPILDLVKGCSLRAKNRGMYDLLDRLYQARNEIMHEGRLTFSWSEQKISQLREDIQKAEQVISWVHGL